MFFSKPQNQPSLQFSTEEYCSFLWFFVVFFFNDFIISVTNNRWQICEKYHTVISHAFDLLELSITFSALSSDEKPFRRFHGFSCWLYSSIEPTFDFCIYEREILSTDDIFNVASRMMLFLIYAHMCFMKPCQVANISSHFDNALTILQYNTTKVTIYPYYRIS